LLASAAEIFPGTGLEELRKRIAAEKMPGHLASMFGTVCRSLNVPEEKVAEMFLYVNLRGGVSAAVRLGIVGPLVAQGIQFRLTGEAQRLAIIAQGIKPDDVAQTAPVADLLQGCHDRLYSRLFQS